MRGRRWVIALLSAAVALTATACWSRKEIQRLAFVMLVGVDQADNGGFDVIIQVARPNRLPSGGQTAQPEPAFMNLGARAPTLAGAMNQIERQMPRRLYFAHLQAIIIGRSVAEQGVEAIIEWARRTPEVRLTVDLVVADETARSVLESTPAMELESGRSVARQLELEQQFASGTRPRLREFLYALRTPGRDPSTPVVRVIESQPPTAGERELQLFAVAVFEGVRMRAVVRPPASDTLGWLEGRGRGGIVEIPPSSEWPTGLAVEVLAVSRKVRAAADVSGRPKFEIDVRIEARLRDAGRMPPPSQDKPLAPIERAVAAVARDNVETLLRVLQEMGSDVIGLGEAARQQQYARWSTWRQDWDGYFRQARIAVSVAVKIRVTGLAR